jgi:hypothetical protein
MSRSPRRATAGVEALKRSGERRHVAGQLLLPDPGLTGQKRSAGNMPAAAGRMPALPYAPRLKRNRYSSNRIMAPTTDMIQPAT